MSYLEPTPTPTPTPTPVPTLTRCGVGTRDDNALAEARANFAALAASTLGRVFCPRDFCRRVAR